MKNESDAIAVAVAKQIEKLTRLRPSLAMVLGSGFCGLATAIRTLAEVDYADLPGFIKPTVPGHPGKLSIGYFGPTPLIVLNGRSHYYEGHSMAAITFPIRVLAELGIKHLVLTNAAGGINRRFKPGDFMGFTDHLNFMGTTPLREGRDGALRRPRDFTKDDDRTARCVVSQTAQRAVPTFVDLTCAYDPRLRTLLRKAAKTAKIALRWGVYAAVCGPCYETPAEIRAFARLGADAVGMSTVPEVIVARQCGVAVTAVSCITNYATGRSTKPLSHEDVLATGRKMEARAIELLRRFADLYAIHSSPS